MVQIFFPVKFVSLVEMMGEVQFIATTNKCGWFEPELA
jgi:hypothetical protein